MASEKYVQSDFAETDPASLAYIKNKPNYAIWEVTDTDPGEGKALADNHYIAVVGGEE